MWGWGFVVAGSVVGGSGGRVEATRRRDADALRFSDGKRDCRDSKSRRAACLQYPDCRVRASSAAVGEFGRTTIRAGPAEKRRRLLRNRQPARVLSIAGAVGFHGGGQAGLS